MDRQSAPGPDGFGPSFYRAAWHTVKPKLMAFMHSFHRGDAQLERINRSYMVLIPKTPGATKVDAFRPICLQNCSIKILAKTLTRRLQMEIGELIDLNQTGFLKGRSIADIFVYAAEVVQACQRGNFMPWSSNWISQRLLILSAGLALTVFCKLRFFRCLEAVDPLFTFVLKVCCAC